MQIDIKKWKPETTLKKTGGTEKPNEQEEKNI
jgi:hypothetical protein